MFELVVWLLIAVLAAFWFLTGAWAFDIANQKGYPERTFLASLLGPFVLFELRTSPTPPRANRARSTTGRRPGRLRRDARTAASTGR